LTQAALLTTSEQITLRRVAHGQAIPGTLSAQDLTRLRALGLIGGPPQAPVVTADGQRCFDALPRPAPLSDTTVAQALTDTLRSLRQGRTQRPQRSRGEKARC
jgi:hypothetical protein